MQLSWQHFVGGIGLVFAAMIAWFGAIWLNLQGANLWVFRFCFFLVLALAVGAIVWWLRNRQKTRPAGATSSGADSAPGTGVAEDILLILREAESRVASSTQLPRGTRLSSLPVIFLVGDSAGGKTCVATQSGLEPELLSGQVYQEGNIAPTRLANIWFARKAVFVEMGGKTLGDANLWTRLLHRLAPGKLRSIFSGKPAAPRAAVVCYDSEKLAKAAGAEEITVQSRAIRARLEQISQTLGINFPVYVLFTRADRLPFFDDFFRNLSDSEVTQVLGVTLPPLPASATGVYAEQETKRLTGAFNSMFYSLAECRPGLLYRERNSEKLPGIYEFPRELQKRIAIATQFLVDLCRPSHLRTSAFLRGFYFTGIRQVEAANPLGGTVMASKTSLMPARPFSGNATSIMRADDFTKTRSQGWQTSTMGGSAGETKKTTQWLFLSHIFSHVILQDRAALGASGTSSRANVLKRVLLAIVGAVATIWLFGMIISFFGNRALEQDVRSAAEAIARIQAQTPAMASLEDLQRLDAARRQLEILAKYERSRIPLHLRWGLYSGKDVYADFRSLYFTRFKHLLLEGVQTQLGESLRVLPPTASSNDEWQRPYESLKAYLITTSKPDKSTREFLSPVLMNRWLGNSAVDEQRQELARAQFDFYAEELRAENPFSISDDSFVVQPARRFLNSFATGPQLVYQKLLVKTNQAVPGFNFVKAYPDAKDVVTETRVVDGAFTRDGWKVMREAISNRDNYAAGDDWVLGPATGPHSVQNVSQRDVSALYEADYKKQWREFVKSASVVGLGGPTDASRKLEKLTGNRSPLLELLCEVSENTTGTPYEIVSAFQSVGDVVKAPCYNLVAQDSTKPYVNALSEFKLCIDRYQENLSNPATQREDAYRSCKTQQLPVVYKEASNAVKTVDHEADLDKCVVSLLRLAGCSSVKPPPPPPDVFCSALNDLSSKYPFRADSPEEATLEKFERFFRPGTGVLSQEIATGQGKSASRASLLRLGESFQRSLYPNGSSVLQYQFAITKTVPTGMKSAQLSLDGTMLRATEAAANTQNFIWPGKAHEAELKVGDSTYYGPFAGPWAVFRLLGNYNWSTAKGGYHLESPPLRSPQGLAFRDPLELRVQGVPLFRRNYLSQLRCSSQSAIR
jgi:type VI secretion system protein ImpL